jgi:DNA-directed RNA polymerase III subunit RPC5
MPADQIVQMRPQFHHIDAHTELEHQLRARDTSAAAVRSFEARAVHMTVKSSADGEEDTGENMTERITAVQQEPWTHHRYIDEDSADAWDTFDNNLFVDDKQGRTEQIQHLASGFEDEELLDTISVTRDAAKLSRKKADIAEKAKGKGKGKGKDKEAAADGDDSDSSATSSSTSASDHDNNGQT